jgi:hypothetical protein
LSHPANAKTEGISSFDEDAMRAALTNAGFDPVEIEIGPELRGGPPPEWPWLVAIYFAFRPFFETLQQEIARDAWQVVKQLVADVWESYTRTIPLDGCVVMEDTDSGVTVVFTDHDLPDDAYEQLLELDEQPRGRYVWDSGTGRWRV